MKKVYLVVKACTRRVLDAERVREYFSKNNYELVEHPKRADIIFFITCAFLNKITELNLKRIKKFQKYDAELIVAGCLPDINKNKLNQIFNGRIITTLDLTNNPEKMDQLFPGNKVKFRDVKDANVLEQNFETNYRYEILKRFFTKNKLTRFAYKKIEEFFLKNLLDEDSRIYRWKSTEDNPICHLRISWSCLGNCSYCAVKKATGNFHSKPLENCINEFKQGLKKGFKLFILNGNDTGAYGRDIDLNLPKLLEKMIEIQGEYKIVIRDLNPRWLIKYKKSLKNIVETKKIKSIYIPIQSSSKRLLKLMNRNPNIDIIKSSITNLRESSPDLSIHTNFILGFPTETLDECKNTVNFIKDMEFKAGVIYPFSLKNGTKAEKIEPKISEKEIIKRMKYAKNFLKKNNFYVNYRAGSHFLYFEKR